MATTPSRRRSFWLGSSTTTPPEDFLKLNRHSIMPSASQLFERLQDLDLRPRSSSKSSTTRITDSTSGDSSSTVSIQTSPRRPPTPSGTQRATLRASLLRKQPSAPALSSMNRRSKAPPVPTPPMPPTPPALATPIWPPVFITSSSDPTHLQLPNILDSRKPTLVPAEVVGGMGFGQRKTSRNSICSSNSSEVDVGKSSFRKINKFKEIEISKLNPHPRSEAPYMLSYNKIHMQSELYTHLLLRKLNALEGPSFHKYVKAPRHVLDLGCGQGSWLAEAATAWPNAHIVGFDLLEVPWHNVQIIAPNVIFKRGNFVRYPLPFSSGSFDLVRIANFNLSVPQSQWRHVLTEVKRVLAPGGRMELIDDEIIFPYLRCSTGTSSSEQSARSSWTSSMFSDAASVASKKSDRSSFEGSTSFLDLRSGRRGRRSVGLDSVESVPALSIDYQSSSSSEGVRTPSEDDFAFSELTWPSPALASFQTKMEQQCRDVEGVFQSMLEHSYGIEMRPHKQLLELLQDVFGPTGKAKKIESYHLSYLTEDYYDKSSSSRMSTLKNESSTFLGEAMSDEPESFHRRAGSVDDLSITTSLTDSKVSSKAAKLLGLDENKPSARPKFFSRPTAKAIFSTKIKPPPMDSITDAKSEPKGKKVTGLFLHPNRFLEMDQREFEMHLCKHIHSLLGCKEALCSFVEGLRDKKGEPLVSREDFLDILWDYERSVKDRFGLPNNSWFDDTDEQEPAVDPLTDSLEHPRPYLDVIATKSKRHSKEIPKRLPPRTLARSIRVFEAIKE